MYHDLNAWPDRTKELKNAAGCPTDTAVSVRTLSGAVMAANHATAAPQSCPTRCAVPLGTLSTSASTSPTSSSTL